MADLEGVIVAGIVHWQHQSFFACFPSNPSYPSILGILAARWRATGGVVNRDGDTSRLVAYATA